jgi:phosphatidylserine/phosphatidylglycerophosphate/cardiolipin synthase-like enzyme
MPGANTDSGAVRLASKADWESLLQAGVQMYEYDPTMLHNKLLIADGGTRVGRIDELRRAVVRAQRRGDIECLRPFVSLRT